MSAMSLHMPQTRIQLQREASAAFGTNEKWRTAGFSVLAVSNPSASLVKPK